jgi:hypothetical protein
MASCSTRRAAGLSLLCLLTLQQFDVNVHVHAHVNTEVYQGCRLTQMAATTGDDRLLDDVPSFGGEEIQHSAGLKGVNNNTIISTAVRHGSSKLDASGFNMAKCLMETEIMSGTMDQGATPGHAGRKKSTMMLELQLSPDRPAMTFKVQSITDEGSTGRHKYMGFHGKSVSASGVASAAGGGGGDGSTRISGPAAKVNGDNAEFGDVNLVADVHGRLAG